jgi:hypothetical protein
MVAALTCRSLKSTNFHGVPLEPATELCEAALINVLRSADIINSTATSLVRYPLLVAVRRRLQRLGAARPTRGTPLHNEGSAADASE